MSKIRRIALLMGQNIGFDRDVIRGIRAYAAQKSDWVFRNGPSELGVIPYLRDWKPHGIIAQLFLPEVARHLVKTRTPIVDTACTIEGLKAPIVDVDHAAVGRMAAEHFIGRGFTHFGYFGSDTAWYSRLRRESYRQRLADAGHRVSYCHAEYVYHLPAMASWMTIEYKLRQWLRQLPKPTAIFCSNDIVARHLGDMCGQLGFRIPGQVAILGVDNDELECLLASPALSSIAIPGERIGYEAAQMLDRMMLGENVEREPTFFPPVRLVVRQSTEMLAFDDRGLSAALAYIHQHARENINVATIVARIGIVRRELERKFRAILGCSVLDELHRVRVELAKGLLIDTQLPMSAVARHSGFRNYRRLTVVFRQLTGMTPSAYRHHARAAP